MALRIAKTTSRRSIFRPLSWTAWLVLGITTCISLWPLYWLFVTALTPTLFAIKTPPDLLPFHPM